MTNSQSKTLISVITPVYNQEKFIGETISSVIGQAYQNWEMLIVDDYSADGSWEIIKEYAQKDPRIKIYRNEKNIGLTKNWEFLINQSRGDYIAFLEGDDAYLPENLARKIEIFQNYPKVKMVYCNLDVIDETGKTQIENFYRKLNIRAYINETIDPVEHLLSRYFPFTTYSQIMIKRDVLVIAGFPRSLDPKEKMFLPSDWDFSFRVSTRAKIYFLDEVLLKNRKFSGTSSAANMPKVCRQFLTVMDIYEKELPDNKKMRQAIKYMRGKTYYFITVYYLENGSKQKAWKNFWLYIEHYPGNFIHDFLLSSLLLARLLLGNRINQFLKRVYFNS